MVFAVQVQSRLVAIASVPDIPSAGAASAIPFSTTTSHLTAVGDVTEMDEEVPVHALERKQNAQIANSPARIGAASTLQAVCLRWVWPRSLGLQAHPVHFQVPAATGAVLETVDCVLPTVKEPDMYSCTGVRVGDRWFARREDRLSHGPAN